MKIERMHITVFVGLAALIWAVALMVQGTSISLDHARPFSLVVSGLVSVENFVERLLEVPQPLWGPEIPLK